MVDGGLSGMATAVVGATVVVKIGAAVVGTTEGGTPITGGAAVGSDAVTLHLAFEGQSQWS